MCCKDCPREATHGVYVTLDGRARPVAARSVLVRGENDIPLQWCRWHAHVTARLMMHPLPTDEAPHA